MRVEGSGTSLLFYSDMWRLVASHQHRSRGQDSWIIAYL